LHRVLMLRLLLLLLLLSVLSILNKTEWLHVRWFEVEGLRQ
jgi:hypothetical protein